MSKTPFKKIAFYYRQDIRNAAFWTKRLTQWITRHYPKTAILPPNAVPKRRKEAPGVLFVLGGDGTILEAAQKFLKWNPLIMGLNLGHVGFLASVRNQNHFINGVSKVFSKKYRVLPRMLIRGTLFRKGKKIFSQDALNEVTVQNLSGLVDITVFVDGHPVQKIHGSGVLASTATGSTAYNMSAHGPIVMPDIKCFVITELFDHNIPTPSLVIKRNRTITIQIGDFRKRGQFSIKKTGEPADAVLFVGSWEIIALQKGDIIRIEKSSRLIRFIELEKNYFFKSLQEKFAFR
ncbi:MAG: NAD(+)/NADH kinase [Candidatus Sungbacteria bacterium]|nr:NAD(+)/NADH kinase [Candidatus Sungbacteria bacterium]